MTKELFQEDLSVINVGLESFHDSIVQAGGKAIHVDWQPPAQGDAAIGKQLANSLADPKVQKANQDAFERYSAASPRLKGIGPAGQELPGMGERTILHAGPPIAWPAMCGPMQGAVLGAIVYEGWAENVEQAAALADNGEINFEPCHHLNAVGPMAGVISPSMPVWVVFNPEQGNYSYSNLNEGLGEALRFGANSPAVIERLKWMQEVAGPVLRAAIEQLGPMELKPLMAQALHMGDEVHNRNVAASSLLLKRLLPGLLSAGLPMGTVAEVTAFIAGNDHFFLNISMAACKSMLDAAGGVPGSTMVTAMARNGVEFGIRISGTGDQWFTSEAPVVDGLYFPGYSMDDAAPDLGDSSITETAGVGGFAMAASPAIVQFVGGTSRDAQAYTNEMLHITLGRNNGFTLPTLDFTGTPAGIDARKVVDTSIAPVINTGIAHRDAGIGQVGAGVTRAPLNCFSQAIAELSVSLYGKG